MPVAELNFAGKCYHCEGRTSGGRLAVGKLGGNNAACMCTSPV